MCFGALKEEVGVLDVGSGPERGVKVSRNRLCLCGSGLKFKKRHGAGGQTHYVDP